MDQTDDPDKLSLHNSRVTVYKDVVISLQAQFFYQHKI